MHSYSTEHTVDNIAIAAIITYSTEHSVVNIAIAAIITSRCYLALELRDLFMPRKLIKNQNFLFFRERFNGMIS